MDVSLHPATEKDLPIVKNLVQYYIYDLSEHMGWPSTPDGRFEGCDDLELYWSDPGKHAFVLRAGNELAGFALILADNDDPQIDYSVTDFFVIRRFRGHGIGTLMARQLFDRFPGRWKVEQFARNAPAVAFWRRVIGDYCNGRFEQSEGKSQCEPLNVLRFCNSLADS
jgi:predicted acetyltransferase